VLSRPRNERFDLTAVPRVVFQVVDDQPLFEKIAAGEHGGEHGLARLRNYEEETMRKLVLEYGTIRI